jgi:hypothetical protein
MLRTVHPDPDPCPAVRIKVKVHPCLDLNSTGSRQKNNGLRCKRIAARKTGGCEKSTQTKRVTIKGTKNSTRVILMVIQNAFTLFMFMKQECNKNKSHLSKPSVRKTKSMKWITRTACLRKKSRAGGALKDFTQILYYSRT